MSAALDVLFGSQSGTAQDVAERIVREARRLGIGRVRGSCLDDFDVRRFSGDKGIVAIFVVSTTGQGEVPENMKRFWKLILRKSLPSNAMQKLKFAVFGLGDSSYPLHQYNVVARRLFQRLLDLGGTPIVPRGLGDDQHQLGYDGELEPWLRDLWKELPALFPEISRNSQVESKEKEKRSWVYHVEKLDTNSLTSTPSQSEIYKAFGSGAQAYVPVWAPITRKVQITHQDHWQKVYHIEISVGDLNLNYSPGDIVLLHPENPHDVVEDFLMQRMHWDPDTMVKISGLHEDDGDIVPYPSPISLRDLARRHLDLLGNPKRSFFQLISQYAKESHEKEKLDELASAEGLEDLYRYNYRERRTYIEVLQDFPSVQIPLSRILDLIPRLQPRQFSISSSPSAHPGHIHVTVAIVEYKTPWNRVKTGICSQWLLKSEIGNLIPIGIKKGSITVGKNISRLLMVGPGTGIAPIRSICHELAQRETKPKFVGVFFGNRNLERDFLYRTEWDELIQDKVISFIDTAFSRDQEHKVYVQHRILERYQDVYQTVIDPNGVVFIAGSAGQMPKSVAEAIVECVAKAGGIVTDEALKLVRTMQKENRYLVECWS